MNAQFETHSGRHAASEGGKGLAGSRGGHTADASRARPAPDGAGGPCAFPDGSVADDELLLAALLDGMDAALCAFDADGVVTHWNREAEKLLGWTEEEAVGRRGLAGWAARTADAAGVETALLGAMHAGERQVHEFPLVSKRGGRVLVRVQSSGVTGPDGEAAGVYCAFSEVDAQIDLERSLALSAALFDDVPWGVMLVDADLRPALLNPRAAAALRLPSGDAALGRPLGDLLGGGMEEVENALQHVLAHGAPHAPTDTWVALRRDGPGTAHSGTAGEARDLGGTGRQSAYEARRCWRSTFLRLSSPLAEQPIPLGVAWLFRDVTEEQRAARDADRLRFRDTQLHRAARAASECEDPMAAATLYMDFALPGFADHALLDIALDDPEASPDACPGPAPEAVRKGHEDAPEGNDGPPPLVRAAARPFPDDEDACGPPVEPGLAGGIPVGYGPGHPAMQAFARSATLRTSLGEAVVPGWAESRRWPGGTRHGLCVVLRSRGRTLGVVTFLRGAGRPCFDRADAAYAEDVALTMAPAVDLARVVRR